MYYYIVSRFHEKKRTTNKYTTINLDGFKNVQHIYSNAHKKLKLLEASSKKQQKATTTKFKYNICKRFLRELNAV